MDVQSQVGRGLEQLIICLLGSKNADFFFQLKPLLSLYKAADDAGLGHQQRSLHLGEAKLYVYVCARRCGRQITALDKHACAYLDLFVVCVWKQESFHSVATTCRPAPGASSTTSLESTSTFPPRSSRNHPSQ